MVIAATLALPLVLALPFPAISKLQVDGDVQAIRFADLDGDGDLDAALTLVRAAGSDLVREVRVFLRGAEGFGAEAAAGFAAGDDVLFADVADLDGDGKAEVLRVDVAGVSVFRLAAAGFAAPERLLEAPSFFRAAASTRLDFAPVARDLDGDGRCDLLLPGREGHLFFRARPDGSLDGPQLLARRSRRGVSHGQNVHFRMTSRLAVPALADWEGDGVPDLLLAFDDQVARVALRPGAPLAPPAPLLDLSALLGAGRVEGVGLAMNSGRFLDVDGDSRCDAVLTDRVARPSLLAGIATRTLLLLSSDLAQAGGPRPRQVIRNDGVTSPPRLCDLDRDGALDLIVTTVRTDLFSKLKESLLDLVHVTFLIYRFDREEERFDEEPVFSSTLSLPVERLLDVGAYGWVTFEADYDGDGRPDFASYGAREGKISVRRGARKGSWFSSAEIAFDEAAFFEAEAVLTGSFFGQDIDGDGRAEIVSLGRDQALILEVGK
ncbi:MAG: VCBS repeat-containing protein [Planctomycetes bacterium]|nr:VCBS repeat-containing protein [Planctomycetota bacterium]